MGAPRSRDTLLVRTQPLSSPYYHGMMRPRVHAGSWIPSLRFFNYTGNLGGYETGSHCVGPQVTCRYLAYRHLYVYVSTMVTYRYPAYRYLYMYISKMVTYRLLVHTYRSFDQNTQTNNEMSSHLFNIFCTGWAGGNVQSACPYSQASWMLSKTRCTSVNTFSKMDRNTYRTVLGRYDSLLLIKVNL